MAGPDQPLAAGANCLSSSSFELWFAAKEKADDKLDQNPFMLPHDFM
jgi:hypothetical protein